MNALSEMTGYNAPGLNGFTMGFLEILLAIVGREVMQLFEEFHSNEFVECSRNVMFMVLIPT